MGCMSGTGTDTENGVYISAHVINATGAPVANVTLNVLELTTRGDSTITSPVHEDGAVLTTDASGRAHFYLKTNGTYMTTGTRGDSVLFIDTLRTRVAPTGPTATPGMGHPEFQVEAPVRATGRLRFHSGLAVDSGRVMLRGTKIVSALTDSGTYSLGWLPPSSQKTVLTVAYEGRARAVRYVKVSVNEALLTVHAPANGAQCLTDSAAATTGALTREGSLATPAGQARLVGNVCGAETGALVRLLQVDASGIMQKSLGSFVIPDVDAPSIWTRNGAGEDMGKAAVPAGCIESESNLTAGLTGRATLRLVNGEIVVNDYRDGTNCLQ